MANYKVVFVLIISYYCFAIMAQSPKIFGTSGIKTVESIALDQDSNVLIVSTDFDIRAFNAITGDLLAVSLNMNSNYIVISENDLYFNQSAQQLIALGPTPTSGLNTSLTLYDSPVLYEISIGLPAPSSCTILALDETTNLFYLGNIPNSMIYVTDLNGNLYFSFHTNTTLLNGIAIYNKIVYIVDYVANTPTTVQSYFAINGSFIENLGNLAIPAVAHPQGIIINQTGVAYIPDNMGIRVFLTSAKNFMAILPLPSFGYNTYTSTKMAIGTNNTILLAALGSNKVVTIDQTGTVLNKLEPKPGEITTVTYLFVDRFDNFYILDNQLRTLTSFNKYANAIILIDTMSTIASSFAINPLNGDIYLAANSTIQVYSANGTFLRSFNSPAFGNVDDIAVTDENQVFILDSGNGSIVVFDIINQTEVFDEKLANITFSIKSGIKYQLKYDPVNQRLYILSQNNFIAAIDLNGNTLLYYNCTNCATMCLDINGNYYLASGNDLFIFNSTGSQFLNFTFSSNSISSFNSIGITSNGTILYPNVPYGFQALRLSIPGLSGSAQFSSTKSSHTSSPKLTTTTIIIIAVCSSVGAILIIAAAVTIVFYRRKKSEKRRSLYNIKRAEMFNEGNKEGNY